MPIPEVDREAPGASLGRGVAVRHVVRARPGHGEMLVTPGLTLVGRSDAEKKVQSASWHCAREVDDGIYRCRPEAACSWCR